MTIDHSKKSPTAPRVARDRLPHSISVVVPCFNEELVIGELLTRLHQVLEAVKIPFEIVLVDDGSSDNTWGLIEAAQKRDPNLRAVRLARNSGQQLALTCGLDHAAGEVVAVMDSDLQDPPELLSQMISHWSEGYDVVYGQRANRDSDSPSKRFFAHNFYRVFARLAGFEIPLDTGDFRLMDRRVVQAVCSMRERHRFTRGIVAWVGFSQTAVRYTRPPRFAGDTKYPFRKSLRLAFDAIASFSSFPLRIGIYLGALISMIGALALIVSSPIGISGGSTPGLIIGAIAIIGGLQLIVLGIIGEYIGRIFEQSQGRPLYLVAESIGESVSPSNSPLNDSKRIANLRAVP